MTVALRGKTALVTGSSSGIGLAIAKALASAGCNVVLTGFGDRDELERLAATLATRRGVGVAYIPADVRKPSEIRALVSASSERFGPVDVLVNNAGIQHIAPVEEFPEDKWDEILAVNLSAAFHATKAVLPLMKRAGWGRIINISSTHGLVASPGKAAYVAAKHGLIGLTKTTALETGQLGICVNAICPGWTRTPLAQKQVQDRAARSGRDIRDEELQMIGEKQAIAQFTTPEQIAELAVFLCSDAAATLTGAALPVDGGWIAQ
jgi:3-hydroxybutyrate dehydrogenase